MGFLFAIELCSLSILDINTLSDKWFADIFSPSIGCLFMCWLFLLLRRSFSVWCSPSYLFLILLLVLWVFYPKKNHCQDSCQGGSPLFSFRSFVFSGLTLFKYLIHFELTFVSGALKGLISFFYVWISSLPRTVYWSLSFLHWICSCILEDEIFKESWMNL